MRWAYFFLAAVLAVSASQASSSAFNQPEVGSNPAHKLYDAGHPTQAVNLPDGSIILVGDFNHYAGVRVDGIVKLSPSGEVDLNFMPQIATPDGRYAYADAAAVVGGHLYVAGNFGTIDGTELLNFARFNLSDLSLDPHWAVVAVPTVTRAMTAIQGDLVYAYTTGSSGNYRSTMHRLDVDNDGSSGWNRYDFSRSIVSGIESTPSGDFVLLMDSLYIAVFDGADGQQKHQLQFPSPDWNWGIAFDIAPDGDILVAGDFHAFEAGPNAGLLRFNAESGALDPTWTFTSDEPDAAFGAVLATDDGGAIVTGTFTEINGVPTASGLARIDVDGSVVPGWGGAHASTQTRFLHAIDSDRLLLIEEPQSGLPTKVHAASLESGQELVLDFSSSIISGDALVTRLQKDGGSVFAGGDFQRAGLHPTVGLAKYDQNLNLDLAFAPAHGKFFSPPSVRTFAVGGGFVQAHTDLYEFLSDGDIVNEFMFSASSGDRLPISINQIHSYGFHRANPVYHEPDGNFYMLSSSPSSPTIHKNLFRYNPSSGLVDPSWSQFAISQPRDLNSSVIANGYYYTGGYNGSIGRLLRVPIASGGMPEVDPSQGVLPFVNALATGPSQEWIYVGGLDGGFGILRRISTATGLIDPSWNPMTNLALGAFVTAIDVADDGDVYLGGRFNGLACDPTKTINVIRLTNGARIDPTWHVDTDQNVVRTVLSIEDGRVLIGGNFEVINGVDHAGFAVVAAATDVLFVDEFSDSICVP